LYYLHDRGASTSERVAFAHTENVPTDDPHKALKWMAWTAMNAEEIKRESGSATTGRSCARPVFSFSLAWHPDEEEPKKWDMIGAARQALMALGLHEHETVMVAHSDRNHPHLHLIVNVVHPETGKASRLSYSRLKLSHWAEEYERQRGKIYCEQRVENNARREQGEKVKYREPEVDLKARITQLYRESDSGAAFQAALAEEGFTLAQGKRVVLLDREGKIHSLYRQIEGVKARDIKARLADLELPDVDEARGAIDESPGKKQETKQEAKQVSEQQEKPPPKKPVQKEEAVYLDRDGQDRKWQESLIDAGIKHGAARKPKPKPQPAPSPPPRMDWPVSPHRLNALQGRQHGELGRFYAENTNARLKLKATLEQQYGQHERGLRRDIGHLEDVLENSGPLRLWWLKVTGQVPRNAEEDLQNMRLTLDNIEWRKGEADQALEYEAAQRRRTIEERHQIERQELQPKMDRQAAHAEPEPPDPTQSGEHDEDFGPSFEF
jgi:hypothetical protein